MVGDAPSFTEWLMVAITFLLLIISFLAWRISRRVAWLTGAMESHSTLMLRIEAKRGVNGEPLKVKWWDPNREEIPFKGAHDKEADLECIYLYLPPKYRLCKHGILRKFKQWVAGTPN